ncbi:hypothetical protein [Nocardia sp. CA-290969]|uniref:hypothetical protein n=1 Tax=Nocardia sp. CA-290969 TaxID=3239986 RepID=UPI003D8E7861
MRAFAEKRSDAPRFVGVTDFADITGERTQQLTRWRRTGRVWVPTPAILLGETERAGWEPEVAKAWRRGLTGVDRPEPVRYLSITEMVAIWHLPRALLWEAILVRESIPPPAIWLTTRGTADAGWSPAENPRPSGRVS